MQQYALLGNPVHHSKSPLIHHLFAQQTGIALNYSALLVNAGDLTTAIHNFTGQGLNITMPFKADAYHLVHEASARARLAGVVNTIKFHADGSRYGDTTDGVGFVRDCLQNLKIPLKDRHILVLGAGGAARGIMEALLTEAPGRLAILNRTWEKAKKLAHDFAGLGPITVVTPLDPGSYDLIINATGGQTTDTPLNLPANFLHPNGLCYELSYGESPTPFSLWASRLKAYYTNGLGMLVEQAAESFYIWHGLRPQTKTVLSLLKMS